MRCEQLVCWQRDHLITYHRLLLIGKSQMILCARARYWSLITILFNYYEWKRSVELRWIRLDVCDKCVRYTLRHHFEAKCSRDSVFGDRKTRKINQSQRFFFDTHEICQLNGSSMTAMASIR